jgi:hypothetical protein
MLVGEVIEGVIAYCGNLAFDTGLPIDPATTRDRVTYGEDRLGVECTGIVTCIWPTVDVIRRARELGANLITSHEALFWNHGDRRDVLAHNVAFQAKLRLLDEWGGTVWRCHDYIHAGVPLADGTRADGIFYGFADKLGWTGNRVGDTFRALDYAVPTTTGRDLAELLVKKLGLNGTRIVGDASVPVSRVRIPMHILGVPEHDTAEINRMDEESIDALVTMEFIDFTTCEYIRDAAMLGLGKCAITVGHFNLEEPGMEYMTQWLPLALGDGCPRVDFVPMGDTYQYVVPA